MQRQARLRKGGGRRRWSRTEAVTAARWLTVTVILLQMALLVGFWLHPEVPPSRGTLWQALWARANQPSFYPLVALLMAGPPATYLALSVRGPHRRWLLGAWALFLPVVVMLHGGRVMVMLEILWKFG